MVDYRTVKRVPMNFHWPIGKVWRGYQNPVSGPIECEQCHGTGWNEATNEIFNAFHRGNSREDITQDEVKALVDYHYLIGFTHVFSNQTGWKQKVWGTNGFWCPKCHASVPQSGVVDHTSSFCTECDRDMVLLSGDDIRLQIPTAEEVNRRSKIDPMQLVDVFIPLILTRTRARRLGVYGWCESCHGRGGSRLPRKQKKSYNSWRECEPPVGTGWQLWEEGNVGGPMSRVFDSAESLAVWCSVNALNGERRLSREDWLRILIADAA